MKFSKYCLKAVTFLSWPYFKSSTSCPSNKATTICGYPDDNLRQVPVRHNRRGVSAEIKVQFSPPVICRLTPMYPSQVIIYLGYNIIFSFFLVSQ